jgi:uncharacterized protein involved in response to NO
LGAVLRVITAFGLLGYTAGMEIAAILWAGGFVLFLAIFGPILFRPRLGGE